MSGCHGYSRHADARLSALCYGCSRLGVEPRTVMPSIRRDEHGVAVCSHRVTVGAGSGNTIPLTVDGIPSTISGARE